MSADAEACVTTYRHPRVKGSARVLLETIAKAIPEGQTMTAQTTIGELSTLMGYQDQAARRGCATLVEVGVIRIVEGGQGKTGRYELLLLPGAGAVDPTLPLKSSALIQAVPVRARPSPTREPDLFDPPMEASTPAASDQRAKNFGDFVRSWLAYFGDFVRSTSGNFGDFVRGWAYVGDFHRSTSYKITEVPVPLDIPSRARGTYNNLNTTTTTAPADDASRSPPEAGSPPCRWFGRSHAWCAGRMHVPRDFHLEERRKLARRPGQTDADLDSQLFARYTETLAVIEGEDIDDKTEFAFWKRVLRSGPNRAAATQVRERADRRRPDVPSGSVCTHEPMCATRHACIDRIIADGRAERERKQA